MVGIKTIDSKTLKSWFQGSDFILIDVREPYEYEESHIEQAINIPLSQLLIKINEIGDLEKKKIILQCNVGVRSMMGCQALKKDGFDGILWNLEGGIKAWREFIVIARSL